MARYRFSGTDLGNSLGYALVDANGNLVLDLDGNPIHPASVPGAGDTVIDAQPNMTGTATFQRFESTLSGTLVSGTVTAAFVSGIRAAGGTINAVEAQVSGAINGGTFTATTMHGATADTNGKVTAGTIDNLFRIEVQGGGSIKADKVINVIDSADTVQVMCRVGNGGDMTANSIFSNNTSGMANYVAGGTLTVGKYDVEGTAGLLDQLFIHNVGGIGGKVIVTQQIGIGQRAGDNSQLFIQGAGSTLVYNGAAPLTAGDLGKAQINIEQGAGVNWQSLTVGGRATGDASVFLRNTSTMFIQKDLILGDAGRGYFEMTDDTSVEIAGNLISANQATGRAYLHVWGGKLTVNGNMILGNKGIDGFGNDRGATFGGEIIVKGALRMGVADNTASNLYVDGAGSKLTLSGLFAAIGVGGYGSLDISAGGKLIAPKVNMLIADQAGSEGRFEISGADFFNQVKAGTTATLNSITLGRGDTTLKVGEDATLTLATSFTVRSPGADIYVWGGTFNSKGTSTIGAGGGIQATLSVKAGDFLSNGVSHDGKFLFGKELLVGQTGFGAVTVITDAPGEEALVAPLAGGAGNLELGERGRGTILVYGEGAELDARTLTIGGRIARPGVVDNGDCGKWVYAGGTGQAQLSGGGYMSVTDTLTLQGTAGEVTLRIEGGAGVEIGGNSAPRAETLLIDAGGTLAGHGSVNVGLRDGVFYTGRIINNGTIEAKDGGLLLEGRVTGSGRVVIDDKSFIEIAGTFSGNIDFNGGHDTVLQLDRPDPRFFKGVIGNLAEGDTIKFSNLLLPAAIAHAEIDRSVLEITFSNGKAWKYELDDNYSNGCFTIQSTDPNLAHQVTATELTFHEESTQVRTGLDGNPTGNPFIDSLIWGHAAWKPNAGPITYWFGENADVNDAVHAHGNSDLLDCNQKVQTWSIAERQTFRQVLDVYSDATGLTFKLARSAEDANLCFWQTGRLANLNAAGSADPLAQNTSGNLWLFFNDTGDFGLGGFTRFNYAHELGHALGLAHPHDGGGEPDASNFPGVTNSDDTGTDAQNQTIFTIMSYVRGFDSDPPGKFGHNAGLGAFDIAALQELYGANTETAIGNDTYELPQKNAVGTGWSCIWDAGGTDTLSNEGSFKSCYIDLNDAPLTGPDAGGFVSRVLGIQGGFTIAKGAQIENAIGGKADDILVGNERANTLEGGKGDDDFVFDAALNGKNNVDRIADFSLVDDTIALDKSIFSALGPSVTRSELRKAGNVTAAQALDNDDHLIYNTTNGALFYDPDGNGLLKQVQFAILTGSPNGLAFNDFFMI
ncbi:hypothetical protein BH10PSE7_BH10PSE7_05590 [soil metagenome]